MADKLNLNDYSSDKIKIVKGGDSKTCYSSAEVLGKAAKGSPLRAPQYTPENVISKAK